MERNIELVERKPILIVKVDNECFTPEQCSIIEYNLCNKIGKDYYVIVVGLDIEEQISFDLLNCNGMDQTIFEDVETMVKQILNK